MNSAPALGFITRATSLSDASRSRWWMTPSPHTKSKLPGSMSSASAFITRKSMFCATPACSASRRACSIATGERSIAVTLWPRRAASMAA